MMIAHMAGIQVFATGGIGGVHRGAETTMDISADLRNWHKPPSSSFVPERRPFLILA